MKSQQRQLKRRRKMFSLYIDPDVLDIVEYYSDKLNITKASVIETVLREATGDVMRKLVSKLL